MKRSPGPFRRSLLLPSGGLVWHVRAWRHHHGWTAYLQELDRWLQGWAPDCRDLLMLGPSAGWCLSREFLGRYRSVVAVDLDPLAPWLFKLRHGAGLRRHGVQLRWLAVDAFAHLERLLREHPGHAVLFCNLLGQHIVHESSLDRTRVVLGQIKHRLRGRVWASFHDCLSQGPVCVTPRPVAVMVPAQTSLPRIADRLGLEGRWQDHQTAEVLPAHVPRHYLAWPITPERMHIIEAGAVA